MLVGTQMVAKGHDFRRITLVAAVNPDSALFSSDFRAPERLFALLMQAGGPRRARRGAGRAQRDVGADLASDSIRSTPRCARHDFAAFAASQLQERAGGRPAAVLAPGAAARRGAHASTRARAFLQRRGELARRCPAPTR